MMRKKAEDYDLSDIARGVALAHKLDAKINAAGMGDPLDPREVRIAEPEVQNAHLEEAIDVAAMLRIQKLLADCAMQITQALAPLLAKLKEAPDDYIQPGCF